MVGQILVVEEQIADGGRDVQQCGRDDKERRPKNYLPYPRRSNGAAGGTVGSADDPPYSNAHLSPKRREVRIARDLANLQQTVSWLWVIGMKLKRGIGIAAGK